MGIIMSRSGFTLRVALMAAALSGLSMVAATSANAGGGYAYSPGCDCNCEIPRDRFVNGPDEGYTEEYHEQYFHQSISHHVSSEAFARSEYYDGDAYGGGESIDVHGGYDHASHRFVHREVVSHRAPVVKVVRETVYVREAPHQHHDDYVEEHGGYSEGYESNSNRYWNEEEDIERGETANLNNFQTGAEPGEPPPYPY